jgi:hypothetical protein
MTISLRGAAMLTILLFPARQVEKMMRRRIISRSKNDTFQNTRIASKVD